MKLKKVKNPDACKALHKVIFPADEWKPKRNEQFWLLYDQDGMPVGFCSCHVTDGDTVFLSRSGLLPGYQGRGLQKTMIKARLSWAKRSGYAKAITYTTLDNATSFSNLQKCGFRLYLPQNQYAGKKMLYWIKDV